MSWISRRPLTTLAIFALTLRVACAIMTEFKPLFPAYYYTDATRIHACAVSALQDDRAGRSLIINGSLSERVQILLSFEVYRTFGPHPLTIKLLNAFLGALAVTAFAWSLCMAFPARAASAAGLAAAVWPSHIFFTSQNLKEAPVILLSYAAIGAAFAAGLDAKASRAKVAAFSLGAGLALLGVGIYRSYVLTGLGTALLIALVLAAWRPPRTNPLLTVSVILAVFMLYPYVSRGLLASFHAEPLGEAVQERVQSRLIPVTYSSDSQTMSRPTTPEGISGFRSSRQSADRFWAEDQAHREIGTQIYPDATFKTWLDVALYLPKGAFTVLFMPLPGLYPMDGKLGRWAAAGENIVLLLLALLGLRGAARGPKTPARFGLIAFFAAMTSGAALLEFDLGSAGRHKLLYLPMLFPFAAEEALRLFKTREPS